jgi:hypothetical protein
MSHWSRIAFAVSSGLSLVAVAGICLAAPPTSCVGDCDSNGTVSLNELVTGVNIVLGTKDLGECEPVDCNGSGRVTIGCLVKAVSASIDRCPSNVSSPNVEGPVTGGAGVPFIAATSFDLAEVGYSQAEYFFGGTATAYVNDGPLGPDGKWAVAAGTTAAYKTRMVVYRPIDRANFNGTVFAEWLNVTGGIDAAADWIMVHTELTRSGYAWVGVSAQFAGVEGGGSIVGASMPLKTADPVRYGSLSHPGDSFSYDIYSQVAQAIRQPSGIDPLGDLDVETVIAIGESQSAFRLAPYVNGIHPVARVYDGFLIHSRSGGGAALSQAPQPNIFTPSPLFIRDDLDVPVFTFETETDVSFLGFSPARQADTDRLRLWEVAGTAHADTYTTVVGMTDLGNSPDAELMKAAAEELEIGG